MLYKHLSEYDRAFIDAYLKIGKSIRWIANSLSRSPSTVSREIMRNGVGRDSGITANEKSLIRRRKSKKINIEKYKLFINYLHDNFDKRIYSIQSLIAIAKKHNLFENIPSHQSVYSWINMDLLKLKKYQLLRSNNKYKRRSTTQYSNRGKKHRVPIHMRPQYINNRSQVGHWEGDSVTMSRSGCRIITLVERKTRFGITIKSPTQNMKVNYELIKTKISSSNQLFKSITFDNGPEFNQMYKLKDELGIKIYYCHPYAPSERGTNEVWNGMLRRFFPKGTNINKIDSTKIYVITNLINNMPRKILNWESSKDLI